MIVQTGGTEYLICDEELDSVSTGSVAFLGSEFGVACCQTFGPSSASMPLESTQ